MISAVNLLTNCPLLIINQQHYISGDIAVSGKKIELIEKVKEEQKAKIEVSAEKK